MIAIGHITLANADNGSLVAIIMQIEPLGGRPSGGCSSHYMESCCVPDDYTKSPYSVFP